ncbi:MAG TPA: hypothetical protein VJ964_04195 [Balneolaceae bacterium]|nr:hypothetical protein [Balneolaceae bacterium]
MAGKSGQSQAASKVQKYPSWYPEHSVVNTDTVMYAYATTIDEDSASAVDKAVAWAKSEMQSSLSDKLENIRSDAVRELGSDSGLDSPGFLIALRHADDVVQNLAQTGNAEVKTVEGYNSYRGFAEIKVAKDKLIDEIGKRLGGHEKAWNAMKESKAFQNF